MVRQRVDRRKFDNTKQLGEGKKTGRTIVLWGVGSMGPERKLARKLVTKGHNVLDNGGIWWLDTLPWPVDEDVAS